MQVRPVPDPTASGEHPRSGAAGEPSVGHDRQSVLVIAFLLFGALPLIAVALRAALVGANLVSLLYSLTFGPIQAVGGLVHPEVTGGYADRGTFVHTDLLAAVLPLDDESLALVLAPLLLAASAACGIAAMRLRRRPVRPDGQAG